MTTFKITNNITIEAEYYETRYSWGHKAYLFINGRQVDQAKAVYYNRTWESYKFQSVMQHLISKTKALTDDGKRIAKNAIDKEQFMDGRKSTDELKTVAMIAGLGNLFGQTQKEKNDWKERMIKAGLENKGLIMPDDWDTLSEDDKEARLDLVIKELGK